MAPRLNHCLAICYLLFATSILCPRTLYKIAVDSESEKILEDLILKHRSCEGIVVVATHSNFKIDKAHKLNMGSHIMSGSNLTQSKLTSYQDKNSGENWQEW